MLKGKLYSAEPKHVSSLTKLCQEFKKSTTTTKTHDDSGTQAISLWWIALDVVS